MTSPPGTFLLAAGFSGAAGVALSALGSHAGGGNSTIAGTMLLLHAPAFLALSMLTGRRLLPVAGLVLVLGLVVFAGDLVMRERMGAPLFPMAAPIGGGGLILGWLLVAASGIRDLLRPR